MSLTSLSLRSNCNIFNVSIAPAMPVLVCVSSCRKVLFCDTILSSSWRKWPTTAWSVWPSDIESLRWARVRSTSALSWKLATASSQILAVKESFGDERWGQLLTVEQCSYRVSGKLQPHVQPHHSCNLLLQHILKSSNRLNLRGTSMFQNRVRERRRE